MSVEITSVALGFDQCYVLKGEAVIAVDGGQPNRVSEFDQALRAAAIARNDVRLVVLTHGHWDHIGSAPGIRALTGARLAMHRYEAVGVADAPTPLSPGVTVWGKVLTALHKVVMPLIEVPPVTIDVMLDDDGLSLEDYGIPGRVIHTPGHTRGSVSVLLDSGQAFVGDLAMNRFPLRLSPGLPIFADDWAAVLRSWRTLLDSGVSKVYPAHGEPFPASVIENAIAAAESIAS